MTLYDRITCKTCAAIVAQAPKNEHDYPVLSDIRNVGSCALVSGHAYMHTKTGITALCITEPKS